MLGGGRKERGSVSQSLPERVETGGGWGPYRDSPIKPASLIQRRILTPLAQENVTPHPMSLHSSSRTWGRQCPPPGTESPPSLGSTFCLRCRTLYRQSKTESWTPSWLGDFRQQPTEPSCFINFPDPGRNTESECWSRPSQSPRRIPPPGFPGTVFRLPK